MVHALAGITMHTLACTMVHALAGITIHTLACIMVHAGAFAPTAIKVHAAARFDSSLVYLNPRRDYFGLKPNNRGRESIREYLQYVIISGYKLITFFLFLKKRVMIKCCTIHRSITRA